MPASRGTFTRRTSVVVEPESFLTDAEIVRMRDRAFGRAARAWQEARQPDLSNSVRMMLVREAESEEATWDRLQHEYLRRRDAIAAALSGDHEHEWGPIERAHFTDEPHRKCQVEGCRMVSLDLDDEEEQA